MASPVQRYQQEMHENIGFFATWLPGDLLELGDIGTLKDGVFRKSSSLGELGIAFQASALGPSQNLQYASKSGTVVSVDSSIALPQPLGPTATIKVEFSSEGSFLFHASNVRNRRVENSAKLSRAVLQAWKNGKWKNKNWYIIESVHQADCATVIVSEDVSAGVTFNAKGTLTGIPLADAQVALSVSQSRGRMTQVIAGRNLRPLFSCLRVRQGWFSDSSVEPVRGETVNPGNSLFVRPGIVELLES
jgi:hypothetical protein